MIESSSVCVRQLLASCSRRNLCYTKLKSISLRSMSSAHVCSNLLWRGTQVDDSSIHNWCRVSAFSMSSLLKTDKQWYHGSGKVMKLSGVDSKPEKSRFEDIQVEGVDGQSMSKMKRFQAEQLAKERGLKLVLISAVGESQPISRYRLLTNLEYRTQIKQLKQTQRMNKSPEIKTLKVNANIANHDLRIKVSHIVEWLQSGHSVKIAIVLTSGSRKSLGMGDDEVFNSIVSASKEIAIVKQAKKTATQMLFHLVPKEENTSELTEETSVGGEKNQKPFKFNELKQMRDNVETKGE